MNRGVCAARLFSVLLFSSLAVSLSALPEPTHWQVGETAENAADLLDWSLPGSEQSPAEYLAGLDQQLSGYAIFGKRLRSIELRELVAARLMPALCDSLYNRVSGNFMSRLMRGERGAVDFFSSRRDQEIMQWLKEEMLHEAGTLDEQSLLVNRELQLQMKQFFESHSDGLRDTLEVLRELVLNPHNGGTPGEDEIIHHQTQPLLAQAVSEAEKNVEQFRLERDLEMRKVRRQLERALGTDFKGSTGRAMEILNRERSQILKESAAAFIRARDEGAGQGVELFESVYRDLEDRRRNWETELQSRYLQQKNLWEEFTIASSSQLNSSLGELQQFYKHSLSEVDTLSRMLEETELNIEGTIALHREDLLSYYLQKGEVPPSDSKTAGDPYATEKFRLIKVEQQKLEKLRADKAGKIYSWLERDLGRDADPALFNLPGGLSVIGAVLEKRQSGHDRLVSELNLMKETLMQKGETAFEEAQERVAVIRAGGDASLASVLEQTLVLYRQQKQLASGYRNNPPDPAMLFERLSAELTAQFDELQSLRKQFDALKLQRDAEVIPEEADLALNHWIEAMKPLGDWRRLDSFYQEALSNAEVLVQKREALLEASFNERFNPASTVEWIPPLTAEALVDGHWQQVPTFAAHLQSLHNVPQKLTRNGALEWVREMSATGNAGSLIEQYSAAALYLRQLEGEAWPHKQWVKDYDAGWLVGDQVQRTLEQEGIYDIKRATGLGLQQVLKEAVNDRKFAQFYSWYRRGQIRTDLTAAATPLMRKVIIEQGLDELVRSDLIVRNYSIAAAALAPTVIGGLALAIQASNAAYRRDQLERWLEGASQNYCDVNSGGRLYRQHFEAAEKDARQALIAFENAGGDRVPQNTILLKMKNGEYQYYQTREELALPLTGGAENARTGAIAKLEKFEELCRLRDTKEKQFDDIRNMASFAGELSYQVDYSKEAVNGWNRSLSAIQRGRQRLQTAISARDRIESGPELATGTPRADAQAAVKSWLSESALFNGRSEEVNAHYLLFTDIIAEKGARTFSVATDTAKRIKALEAGESAAFASLKKLASGYANRELQECKQFLNPESENHSGEDSSVVSGDSTFFSSLVLSAVSAVSGLELSGAEMHRLTADRELELNAMAAAQATELKSLYLQELESSQTALNGKLVEQWQVQMEECHRRGNEEWELSTTELQRERRLWAAGYLETVNRMQNRLINQNSSTLSLSAVREMDQSGELFQSLNRGMKERIRGAVERQYTMPAPAVLQLASSDSGEWFSGGWEASNEPLRRMYQTVEQDLAVSRNSREKQWLAVQENAIKRDFRIGWADLKKMMQEVDRQSGNSLERELMEKGFRREAGLFSRQTITGQTLFSGTLAENQKIDSYKDFNFSGYSFSKALGTVSTVDELETRALAQQEEMSRLLVRFLGNAQGLTSQIMRKGSWNEARKMDSRQFFNKDLIGGDILAESSQLEGEILTLIEGAAAGLGILDEVNQYVVRHDLEVEESGFEGEFGKHLGLSARLRPDMSWLTLREQLEARDLPVTIENMRNLAFISGLEGSGEKGRMLGDLQIYELQQNQGMTEFGKDFWDVRMWDDEGIFFKAPSLKDGIDLLMTAVTSGLTMGAGLSVWGGLALSKADDLFFTVTDMVSSNSSAEASKAWIDFGIDLAASAASTGLGTLGGLESLENLGGAKRFFADLSLSLAGSLAVPAVAGIADPVQVQEGRLSWDSTRAVERYFGKNQIASVTSAAASGILTSGLNRIDSSGYLKKDRQLLESFNKFAGSAAALTINGVMTESADLNLLSTADLTFGRADTGLLSLHIEKNRSSMTLSDRGTAVNPWTLYQAGLGLSRHDELRRIRTSDSDSVRDNRQSIQALASLSRAQGRNTALNKKVKELISGAIKLIEGKEGVTGKTTSGKEGMTIEVAPSLFKGSDESAKDYLAVVLAHELQRDGVNRENSTETIRSLMAHAHAASLLASENPDLMENYPALLAEVSLIRDALKQGNLEALADYSALAYQSDKDYWLMTEWGELVEDGSSHLTWEISGERLITNSTGSVSQALVQYLGLKRVKELVGVDKAEDLASWNRETLMEFLSLSDSEMMSLEQGNPMTGHQINGLIYLGGEWKVDTTNRNFLQKLAGETLLKKMGYSYSNEARRWKAGDGSGDPAQVAIREGLHQSVLYNPQLNSDGEYDGYTMNMTVNRNWKSYHAKTGWVDPADPENARGLDYMVFEMNDLDQNPVATHLVGNVQTVDVYSKVQKRKGGKGIDRRQPTPIGVEGNTVNSADFYVRWGAQQRYDVWGVEEDSPIFIITDFTTLDGDQVDHESVDGDPGGRWLIHPDLKLYSDGCFIPTMQESAMLFDTIYRWGLNDRYDKFNIPAKLQHFGERSDFAWRDPHNSLIYR